MRFCLCQSKTLKLPRHGVVLHHLQARNWACVSWGSSHAVTFLIRLKSRLTECPPRVSACLPARLWEQQNIYCTDSTPNTQCSRGTFKEALWAGITCVHFQSNALRQEPRVGGKRVALKAHASSCTFNLVCFASMTAKYTSWHESPNAWFYWRLFTSPAIR